MILEKKREKGRKKEMAYFEVEKNFIKEFNKVKKNKELSAAQKLIYQHLALSALESDGYIATSYRQVAKDCGLSLRTVTRGIETLVENNLIEIMQQTESGVNFYHVTAIAPNYTEKLLEGMEKQIKKRIEAGDSLKEIIRDLNRGI